MNPERWNRIELLYNQAIERSPDLRHTFLTEECAGDEGMLHEVESLLDKGERPDDFMERPALEVAAETMKGEPHLDLAGRRLNHYEIMSKIGSGGMGDVYRARDTRLNREVAIKVLPDGYGNDTDRISRFHREAHLLALLNHPHIGAIYGLEEDAALSGLALELVDGETLADRIARGPMPVPEALRLGAQIARALEAAHHKGIVHRDLKPANIKITPDQTIKVLDFGLAKMFAPSKGVSVYRTPPQTASQLSSLNVRAAIGTPSYMSPEQMKGGEVDQRADIWAWGCVMYEMLAGKRPFDGDNVADVIEKVTSHEPDWSVFSGVKPQLILSVLRRCLQKDPSRRFHEVAVIRDHIESIEQDLNNTTARIWLAVLRLFRRVP